MGVHEFSRLTIFFKFPGLRIEPLTLGLQVQHSPPTPWGTPASKGFIQEILLKRCYSKDVTQEILLKRFDRFIQEI